MVEATHKTASQEGTGRSWLCAIAAIGGTLLFLWYFLRLDTPTAAGAQAVLPPFVAASVLGNMIDRPLPGGTQVRFPEKGVEGRLLTFVVDPKQPLDKGTWFDFDRLTFDSGAATLRPESHDQLGAVAQILKAYPRVKVKIGGYTDSVGQAAANQRLSEERAANVRGELVKLGIAADRLTAEGYGEQHPVADNATEEGRARNRRISMRVDER
jgi:outer membrane protein OmpA-like peptidoglycan-associated protein